MRRRGRQNDIPTLVNPSNIARDPKSQSTGATISSLEIGTGTGTATANSIVKVDAQVLSSTSTSLNQPVPKRRSIHLLISKMLSFLFLFLFLFFFSVTTKQFQSKANDSCDVNSRISKNPPVNSRRCSCSNISFTPGMYSCNTSSSDDQMFFTVIISVAGTILHPCRAIAV